MGDQSKKKNHEKIVLATESRRVTTTPFFSYFHRCLQEWFILYDAVAGVPNWKFQRDDKNGIKQRHSVCMSAKSLSCRVALEYFCLYLHFFSCLYFYICLFVCLFVCISMSVYLYFYVCLFVFLCLFVCYFSFHLEVSTVLGVKVERVEAIQGRWKPLPASSSEWQIQEDER